MNWRELLRNRWTWVAAGVGGIAGLVVLVRRRSAGGGGYGAAPGSEQAPGFGPGGFGYFDSTATDVAEQLGQAQAGFQRMFDDFTRDVEQRLADLPVAAETPPVLPPQAPPRDRTRGLPTPPAPPSLIPRTHAPVLTSTLTVPTPRPAPLPTAVNPQAKQWLRQAAVESGLPAKASTPKKPKPKPKPPKASVPRPKYSRPAPAPSPTSQAVLNPQLPRSVRRGFFA